MGFVFQAGQLVLVNGTIDLTTIATAGTLKAMLVSAIPAQTANSVAALTEIVATGYTGGHAGASRLALAVGNLTFTREDGSLQVRALYGANLDWGNLGGAVNDTIVGIVIFAELANDAASIPLGFSDIPDRVTNGTQFLYTPPSDGLFRWGQIST